MRGNTHDDSLKALDSDKFYSDKEEEIFKTFLENPCAHEYKFNDPLFARVHDVFTARISNSFAHSLDFSVLVRQCLRRASLRENAKVKFRLNHEFAPLRKFLIEVGISVLNLNDGKMQIESLPWSPDWLIGSDQYPIDKASLGGCSAGVGSFFENLAADPFFEEATGYSSYRSSGQRAAVRAIVSMPPSGTLIALLPTGSGKTEVILALNKFTYGKTIIVIVPTTALAYDFDRRFKEEFSRRNKSVLPEDLVFAWTGETDEEKREDLRSKLNRGKIPILVTSPESISGSLLKSVRMAADSGRIGGFIVDEAHLISAWGRNFRPEFQLLGSIRDDLLNRSLLQNGEGFKTALLSATLGPSELGELYDFFGKRSEISLIAANAIRPELDIWISKVTNRSERNLRVMEALRYLPRPAIIYVNKPEDAEQWKTKLIDQGFSRLAVVTGPTAGRLKKEVLAGLRSGAGHKSRYDIVIGTSAFGLGIDNDQIRTVIHACLPESLNRWYQEIGRGGRDGHYALSLLIPATRDKEEARSLSIRMLLPETAHKRWALLWGSRINICNKNYIDANSIEIDNYRGSYNRMWNAQVLQGLESLGCIKRELLPIYEAEQIGLDIGSREEPRQWETLDLLDMRVHSKSFFMKNWDEWRKVFVDESDSSISKISKLINSDVAVCEQISNSYTPDQRIKDLFGTATLGIKPKALCGKCPECRRRKVPSVIEPPPRFKYIWHIENSLSDMFRRFADQCVDEKRLVLIFSENLEEDAIELADLFYNLGVRVFAGVKKKARRGDWVLWDSPDVHPDHLPPLPAFIAPTDGKEVSAFWNILSARQVDRDGEIIPVVICLKKGTTFNGNLVEKQISTSARNVKMFIRSLLE